MPEISQSELETLRRSEALLNKMWNDPKEGLNFKRKVKEYAPDARIPELDMIQAAAQPFEEKFTKQAEEIKTMRERLEAREKKEKDDKEESELEASLARVKSQFKFTDEGLEKVIARMKEKNNPDAEAAAAWVAAQERKAKPISGSNIGPSALNLYGSKTADEQYAALNKDPIAWADNEIATMLNEFAQQDAA